jgi:hypothetical protein
MCGQTRHLSELICCFKEKAVFVVFDKECSLFRLWSYHIAYAYDYGEAKQVPYYF